MSTLKLFLSLTVAALLIAGCDQPSKPVTVASKPQSPEDRAIELLTKAVQSDHLYPDIKDEKCLEYLIEDAKPDAYEIAIHENHVDGCGGDPLTSPVRDRFVVSSNKGVLQIYDPVNGEYIEYQHKKL